MNRVITSVATAMALVVGGMFAARSDSAEAREPELRQVNDPARDQGLSLGFADASGAFLGAVQVIIRDRSGTELVNTVVDGPWFFAPLPAGTYTVTATFDADAKQATDVRLTKDHVTVIILYWDLNVPPTQMLASAATEIALSR